MWSVLRFLYVALLPLGGCLALSWQGWSTHIAVAIAVGVGLIAYAFLQAVLISAERKAGVGKVEIMRGVLPIVVAGAAAGFQWDRWLIEQMLLETGSFSLVIAVVLVRKASWEGLGGIAVVFVLFVTPALGLIYVAGRALVWTREGEFSPLTLMLLTLAFGLAFYDGWKRFYPYGLGSKQMEDLDGSGWQIGLIILWAILALFGVPCLLI